MNAINNINAITISFGSVEDRDHFVSKIAEDFGVTPEWGKNLIIGYSDENDSIVAEKAAQFTEANILFGLQRFTCVDQSASTAEDINVDVSWDVVEGDSHGFVFVDSKKEGSVMTNNSVSVKEKLSKTIMAFVGGCKDYDIGYVGSYIEVTVHWWQFSDEVEYDWMVGNHENRCLIDPVTAEIVRQCSSVFECYEDEADYENYWKFRDAEVVSYFEALTNEPNVMFNLQRFALDIPSASTAEDTNADVSGDVVEGDSPDFISKEESIMKKINRNHEYAKQVLRNKLDRRQVAFHELTMGSDYDVERKTNVLYGSMRRTSYGMNKVTRRFFDNAPVEAVVVADGLMNVVKNMVSAIPFTTEMLKVNVCNMDAKEAVMFAENIKDNLLAIQFIGSTDVVVWTKFVSKNNETTYRLVHVFGYTKLPGFGDNRDISLRYGKPADKAVVNALRTTPCTWKKYGFIYAGPSNQRQMNFLLFEVHQGEDKKAFMARMKAMFNDLTGGLIDTLEEMVKIRGGLSKDKLFKLNSRISLAFTPMTPTVRLHSFAYYHGEFANSSASDGQWLLKADPLADWAGLDVRDVCGLALQCRITDMVIAKGMAAPVSEGDMEVTILVSENDMEEAICKYEVRTMKFAEFRSAYLADSLDKGVVYVVDADGESRVPDVFVDKNSMKAVCKDSDGFYLNIVEVRSQTRGCLNKQDAACIAHLPGAVEFVEDLGKSHIDRAIAELESVLNANDNVEETVVNPDLYWPQLITKMSPAYAAHSSTIFTDLVKDKAKSVMNAVNNLKFDLNEGDCYKYLQNDYLEMISGVRVLANGKIYDPANNMDGKKVNLTRNPKTGRKENYPAVTVSLETIFARIDKLVEDGKVVSSLAEVAKRMYLYADTALVITPADPKVKGNLGGADCDGDGATLHYTERYIEVQEQEPEGVSDIPGARKSSIIVEHYDIEVAEDLFLDGLFGQKDEKGNRITPTSVGVMSNFGMMILSLSSQPEEVKKHVLEEVVIPNISALRRYDGSESAPYERRFTSDYTCINDDDVVDATEAFYKSDLSMESFNNFLEDAIKMTPSVVGRGIDVNKTGDVVHTGYLGVLSKKDIDGTQIRASKLMSCVGTDSLDYEVKVDKDTASGKYAVSYLLCRPNPKKKICIDSQLTPVRERLMAYAADKFNELLAKTVLASEAESNLVNSGIGARFVDMADVKMVKNMHSMLIGNKHLQTEDKKHIRQVLANTLRKLFDQEADAIDRFAVLKRLSAQSDSNDVSSFVYVLGEELIQSVQYISKQEGWKVNDLVGYPAQVKFVYQSETEDHSLDTLNVPTTFTDGVSFDGNVVTDKKVNGTWTVKKIAGKMYVTKTAEECFKVPEYPTQNIALLLKSYDPKKHESKYNRVLRWFEFQHKFVRIANERWNSAIIMSEDYDDSYPVYTPHHFENGMRRLDDTRFNRMVKNNGMWVDQFFQYKDDKGQTNTIITGRFVKTTKPMPKKKSVKAVSVSKETKADFEFSLG